MDLRGAETINELELLYWQRRSRGTEVAEDRGDTAIVDFRDTELQQTFLINWKAVEPMRVFFVDNLPVEALAFPYIFCEGRQGERHTI